MGGHGRRDETVLATGTANDAGTKEVGWSQPGEPYSDEVAVTEKAAFLALLLQAPPRQWDDIAEAVEDHRSALEVLAIHGSRQ